MRKLIALNARCHQMLGDLPAALNACSEGVRLDPDDAELHFRKAVLHRKGDVDTGERVEGHRERQGSVIGERIESSGGRRASGEINY